MTLLSNVGYGIVPLHLGAGLLFALLPASPYQAGYYALYGGILTLLAAAVVFYGWAVRHCGINRAAVCLQVLLACLAVAVPLFLIDFSDPWHAILYLPILGGSLLVCLVAGLLVRRGGGA